MRPMELVTQIDLTELFEPENFLERIQCIGTEQNKCLPGVYIFPDFWEVELATLGLIAINDIKDGIKIKRNGNYQIDGFNQINWSDGTNGTECVRIDRAAGSVWLHWMKLSDRLKCKHIELIELTICMVRGTESGARIYNK